MIVWDLEHPDQRVEIFEIARSYFIGEKGDDPIIEIISDGKAVAKKDVSVNGEIQNFDLLI